MNPKVIGIDRQIYESLKVNGAEVQGVYNSTIHLLLKDKLLTVGHQVGCGKHHLVLDQKIDFYQFDILPKTKVSYKEGYVLIGDLKVAIDQGGIRDFKPYMSTYRLSIPTLKLIDYLKRMIKERHGFNVYTYPKDNPWLNYQFEKIDIFLHAPGLPSALSIMGLGMGLTPLGDDILVGFILGLNTVNKSLPWIEALLTEAKKKTNRLSYQNLMDTYERFYPDIFVDMIEGLFIENDIEKATAILKLGASSGAGILTGFVYGLMA